MACTDCFFRKIACNNNFFYINNNNTDNYTIDRKIDEKTVE